MAAAAMAVGAMAASTMAAGAMTASAMAAGAMAAGVTTAAATAATIYRTNLPSSQEIYISSNQSYFFPIVLFTHFFDFILCKLCVLVLNIA